ncbi:competence protein CoiA family protein [Heyndrickxia oleronia]|uniref:Competence protein CoiA family protein n=2 Tax=Heyndrickxia oleronia TaxID=38875 RepID=A0AAW6T451_9BACI|nr:competence protein CoiA family protein [Heyndrickxia oleronia]
MLTALNETGELVNLIFSQEKGTSLKKDQPFFCPHCKEKVVLKKGNVKIPHFSHLPFANCGSTSEPESAFHLQGKIDLFKWLHYKGLIVEVEKYLPKIQQRPDLLVWKKRKIYAIEYQCSSIPLEDMIKRSRCYTSVGIEPFWIFGGTFDIKGNYHLMNIYKLNDFHWAFTQFNRDDQIHLFSYDPNTKNFSLLSHLTPVTVTKVLASQTTLPLSKLDFPFNFSTNYINIDFHFWLNEKRKWVQKKMIYAKNLKDPFLNAIYYNNHSPLLLPPQIGIPVNFMGICKSHPIEWQYYLWTDGFIHTKIGEMIFLSNLERIFHKRIQRKHIKMRQLPLIKHDFIKQMIYHYLKKLTYLGHLFEIQKGQFQMNKSFSIPNNIEDMIKFEKEMEKKLYSE